MQSWDGQSCSENNSLAFYQSYLIISNYRDDWQDVADNLAQYPVLDQPGADTERQDHTDLHSVDHHHVGQAQRQALLVQLLLHDQKEEGDVTGGADQGEDDEESQEDGHQSVSQVEERSQVWKIQVYLGGVVSLHLQRTSDHSCSQLSATF